MKKLALALVAASLGSGAFAAPEEVWPRPGEGFYLAVQKPPAFGRIAFAYLRATPDKANRTAWKVTVECGAMNAKTGRYVKRVTGTGRAETGRMRAIGGTYDLKGATGGSFIFGIPKDGSLSTEAQFTDGLCPSGRGELSSGD